MKHQVTKTLNRDLERIESLFYDEAFMPFFLWYLREYGTTIPTARDILRKRIKKWVEERKESKG